MVKNPIKIRKPQEEPVKKLTLPQEEPAAAEKPRKPIPHPLPHDRNTNHKIRIPRPTSPSPETAQRNTPNVHDEEKSVKHKSCLLPPHQPCADETITANTFDVSIHTTNDAGSALDDLRKTAKTLIMPSDKKPIYIIKTPSGYALNEKGSSFSWLCSPFEIVKKLRSKNGEMQVVLHIEDETGSHDVTVSADIFSPLNLRNLSKYGIYYSPEYELAVSMYFQQVLAKMPMQSAAQKLGFTQDNGKLRFIGYDDGQFQTESEYNSCADYIDALNDLINGNVALQYLICATMAAALMAVLRFKFKLDLRSYLINVVNAYLTNRDAAMKLCASMWTDPQSKAILASMRSTDPAFYKKLDGRCGIPTLREAGIITGHINKNELGNAIHDECEMDRMTPNGTLREGAEWNTIIVVASAQHMCEASNCQDDRNTLYVHSTDNLTFKKGIGSVDNVSDFASHNYGVIGKMFVELLLTTPEDVLKEDYDSALDTMLSLTCSECSEYTHQLCHYYALTYQTAELLRKIGLAINLNEVTLFMQEQNANIYREHNRAENAMQAIREYVMAHLADTGIRTFPNGSGYADVQSVAITVGLTRTILEDAGFKDVSVILKELDSKGYLIRQGNGNRNGLVSNLTIRGVHTRCYQFMLSDGTLNEAEN